MEKNRQLARLAAGPVCQTLPPEGGQLVERAVIATCCKVLFCPVQHSYDSSESRVHTW